MTIGEASGERARLAYWFRRRAETIFLVPFWFYLVNKSSRPRGRARPHARRVRSQDLQLWRVSRVRIRQQPTKRVVYFRQCWTFNRIIVICATQFDYAFFSCVRVSHQPVETRCDYFILVCQQKDRGEAAGPCVRNAVKVSRDLHRDWTSQQPKVPPAKLTQDHFAQRRWILQDQPWDFGGPRCGDVKCDGRTNAGTERHNRAAGRVTF